MTPLLLLASLAGAAPDPARWPLEATVEIPAALDVRVDLTPAWLAACPDPTSYLLLDPEGREVPYGVRTSDDGQPPRWVPLAWTPKAAGWSGRVHLPPPEVPVQALAASGLPEGAVVRVALLEGDEIRDTSLLWHLPGTGAGSRLQVEVPPALRGASLDLGFQWVGPGRPVNPFALDWRGLAAEPWGVEPARIPVEVSAPIPSGPGTSDREVRLPRPDLPVRALHLEVADALFQRPATLLPSGGSSELVRLARDGVALGNTTVPVAGGLPERVVLRMEDGRSPPLEVIGAEAEVRGAALVVPDTMPGRHRLLGCGPAGRSYDLDHLALRLSETPSPPARPADPEPNLPWAAALASSPLAAPGPAPSVRLHRYARPVTGPPGLVRLDLPEELLARSRPDLGDLRFLDEAGRQVPYVVRWKAVGQVLDGVSSTREERGSTTVLQVTLPWEGLPTEAVVLTTPRGGFARDVVLLAGEAVLARARWEAEDAGGRVLLAPAGRLPGALRVEIQNGDNPPLPLDDLQVVVPAAEAWTFMPEEGRLRLLYGDPATAPPAYDLHRRGEEVPTWPTGTARLGDPEVRRGVPAEGARWPVLAAVAVLALALAGLAARLLRSPAPPAA